MKKLLLQAALLLLSSHFLFAQETVGTYTLYGPNSPWQAYFQVGGSSAPSNIATVFATNGNLHLDAATGYHTYINWYNKGNTFINAQGGRVGIGTPYPAATLHIGAGTGNLHYNDVGILLKPNNGDRALMELHSPDGQNRLVFQSLGAASYLSSMEGKPLFLQSIKGGQVLIGTETPDPTALLTVKGKIAAREIKVTTTAGADFVFEEDYELPSLTETEKFIKSNKHLPGIAPAKEMVADGISLGEMNIKLLQKIEELTLHMIEQEKRLNKLEAQNLNLEKQNKDLQKQILTIQQK